ncbi:hypothetical protein ACTXT7_001201 [Hymenolepis weldensis]
MSILYGWGSCEVGQLGPVSTQESVALVSQPTVVNWPPPGVGKHLVKLSCGYQHTLALDSEGLVYSSGSSEFEQLGHKRRNDAFDKTGDWLCIVSGIGERVRDIVAGPYHSAAITVSGRVYMWGCNTNHQLGRDDFEDNEVGLLNFNHGTIVQISLGLEHTIALTEASEIYTWGSNSQGQLGLGYCSQQPIATPQLVEALVGLPVRQIVSGANHNVLVTPSGSVYVWGSNTQGQLGLGDVESQSNTPVVPRRSSRTENSSNSKQKNVSVPTPHLLKSVKRRGVTYAACGETHSALLTKDGAVFTFGDGRFGQLGHGQGMMSVGQPKQVMELMGDTCVQLMCGRRHTLVVVCNLSHSPPRPRPIVFGCGSEGQLGQPNLQRTFLPVNVIGILLPICRSGLNTMVTKSKGAKNKKAKDLVMTYLAEKKRQGAVEREESWPRPAQSDTHLKMFGIDFPGFSSILPCTHLTNSSVLSPWYSREASPTNFNTNFTEPTLTAVFTGGDHCFAFTHHSGHLNNRLIHPVLSCPAPVDFRKWQPCHLSNIATFSEPLIRRYIEGLPDRQTSASTRRSSSTSSNGPPDISEAIYCLENFSMKSAFKRLEIAFGSIGCLASSLLVHDANRSHYNIGKADHGMDLDAAQALQTELFLSAPVSDARCLIRPLLEAICRPRSNFPDLECLRVFVFLAVSPLLDTPRKDTFSVPDNSGEAGTGPARHYPTVMAGYAIGFVLSAFARAVCRLEGVPLSVLERSAAHVRTRENSWFMDFQPRFFRRLVANLTNFVAFRYCSEHQVEEVNCFNNQSATHAALELLKRLHEINQKRAERISYMTFYIPELTDRFNDRGFANWLMQRNSNEKQINSFAGQSPPPRRFRFWRSKSVPPKRAQNNNDQNFTIFDYPFVFDVACKAKMLQIEARLMQEMAMQNFSNAVIGATLTRLLGPIPQTYLMLEVSRENLISNTLDYLALQSKADLKRPLKIFNEAFVTTKNSSVKTDGGKSQPEAARKDPKRIVAAKESVLKKAMEYVLTAWPKSNQKDDLLQVRFTGEEAIDDGGVLKEFFILIMREILNPAYGMFKVYKDSRMLWFNENNLESPRMFAMVGALCGLAIYNDNIIDLCFPTALFKKLLLEEPTLDDLKELDPTAGRSLQSLLDYEGTDVEDVFCINFEEIFNNFHTFVFLMFLLPRMISTSSPSEFFWAFDESIFE